MKLNELIAQVTWEQVEAEMLRAYDDAQRNMPGYRQVFSDLQGMKPQDSELEIIIEHVTDQDESYFHVSGRPISEEGESYSLMMCPFEEWLGMSIGKETLASMPYPEIMAHCLWEMTFIGFSQEQRESFRKGLLSPIDEDFL